jgi:hypothetical protein
MEFDLDHLYFAVEFPASYSGEFHLGVQQVIGGGDITAIHNHSDGAAITEYLHEDAGYLPFLNQVDGSDHAAHGNEFAVMQAAGHLIECGRYWFRQRAMVEHGNAAAAHNGKVAAIRRSFYEDAITGKQFVAR